MIELEDLKRGPFEKHLGLQENFYGKLMSEDDWSFVIKLSTLFEAACTHVLAIKLNAPELIENLSELDLLNSKYGKIAMLRSMSAITKEQAGTIRALGELRNKLAHKISNVTFTFESYINSLDSQQKDNFIKNFASIFSDPFTSAGVIMSRREYALQNLKFCIFLTANSVLAHLHKQIDIKW